MTRASCDGDEGVTRGRRGRLWYPRRSERIAAELLAPTTQLVLAVALYHEPFARDQLVAFGLIWLGLAAFSLDLIRRSRVTPSPVSQTGR